VSGIFPPDIGGPATFVPKLAKSLVAHGMDVEVLTLSISRGISDQDGYRVNFISRQQGKAYRAIKIYRTISKINPDVIFANGLHEEVAVWLRFHKVHAVAKIVGDPVWERYRNRCKSTVSIHLFNSKSNTGVISFLQRKILSWALSNYSAVTCPSQELCEFVKKWNPRLNPVFIPNGTNVIESQQKKPTFDLVTVSRLVSWKNIDRVIMLATRKNLKLAVVGEGPERESLMGIADPNLIQFLGQQDESEILQILQKSRIFIQLSDYEGLSFALLQALSAGIPTVTSDILGNSQVISNSENGVLVDFSNPEEIDSAVELILSDAEFREKLVSNGKTTIKEFYSEEKRLSQMRELLLEKK
jgi:glycosyltransferase involved in cell wall biosynthesis